MSAHLRAVRWDFRFSKALSFHAQNLERRGASTETRIVLKLYLHGILFYLLSLVLTLGWAFVAALLVVFGFLVGFVIAIGLLVVLLGFANAAVCRRLWFPVKGGLWVYFQEGIIMGIVILIVAILLEGISFLLSPIVSQVALFLVAPPSYGAAGVWVAGFFRVPVSPRPTGPAGPWSPLRPASLAGSQAGLLQRHVVCPTCGTAYDFVSENITKCPKDGTPLRSATQAG